MHILFVCTGNICRSPMAERLALAISYKIGIPNISASSAGIQALIGEPIHKHAALVLERLGVQSTNFSARQLTPRIASDADLVLTMTQMHRDVLLELAPRQLHRTFTLMEAARLALDFNPQDIRELASLRRHLPQDGKRDIDDPIGHPLEYFDFIGNQIAGLLSPVLELCRDS